MGYDTILFGSSDDIYLVRTALAQGRILVTRDTQIVKRRVVTTGQLQAVLITTDKPADQMAHLIKTLKLDCQYRPFTLCLECNRQLADRTKNEVEGRVPPYVFATQENYVECPACHRIYWKGTHWQAMTHKLKSMGKG